MSLDVAFCTDTNEYIDPDKAYDLYWSGLINDKKNFVCPGPGCCAQITCANLDSDFQNMRMVPHYRVYGEHAEECEIFNDKPLNIDYIISTSDQSEKDTLDESIVDTFFLERPSTYYDERTPDSQESSKKNRAIGYLKSEARLKEMGNSSAIYSVRTIVSRYIRYQKDGSIDNRRINIRGKDVHYRSIFKCVWEQDLDNLPDYPIIYYGWAYINRLKSGYGYQVKFKKKFKKSGDDLTTTIMIADSLIERYKIKKTCIHQTKKN